MRDWNVKSTFAGWLLSSLPNTETAGRSECSCMTRLPTFDDLTTSEKGGNAVITHQSALAAGPERIQYQVTVLTLSHTQLCC